MENPSRDQWRRRLTAFVACTLSICSFLAVSSCTGDTNYDQSTPEATVNSLAEMVKNGDIARIPELIHTNDENLARTLRSTGVIFARIQRLSETIREKYPDEVDDLLKRVREDAVEQADKMGRSRGGSGGEQWGERLQGFFLDPAATIDKQMERIGVTYVSDDLYSITFDGKPAFGVGGILLRQSRENNHWYFEWPDNIPGLSTNMPKTDAEWKIMRSILRTVANGVDWTEKAINEGKARHLDDVWDQTVRNVGPNIVLGWLLYEQALKKRPKDVGSAGGGG